MSSLLCQYPGVASRCMVYTRKLPLLDHIKSRLVPDEVTGCLLWSGALCNGYGQIEVNGKCCMVHRLVWELEVGPIPDGYEVDHVRALGCRHRNCANLKHLEAVTRSENGRRRGESVTSCVNGHDYAPDNTYTDARGRRGCKACRVARTRAWRARRAA